MSNEQETVMNGAEGQSPDPPTPPEGDSAGSTNGPQGNAGTPPESNGEMGNDGAQHSEAVTEMPIGNTEAQHSEADTEMPMAGQASPSGADTEKPMGNTEAQHSEADTEMPMAGQAQPPENAFPPPPKEVIGASPSGIPTTGQAQPSFPPPPQVTVEAQPPASGLPAPNQNYNGNPALSFPPSQQAHDQQTNAFGTYHNTAGYFANNNPNAHQVQAQYRTPESDRAGTGNASYPQTSGGPLPFSAHTGVFFNFDKDTNGDSSSAYDQSGGKSPYKHKQKKSIIFGNKHALPPPQQPQQQVQQVQQCKPPQQRSNRPPTTDINMEKEKVMDELTALSSKFETMEREFAHVFSALKFLHLISSEFERKIKATGVFGEDFEAIMGVLLPYPVTSLRGECNMLTARLKGGDDISEIRAGCDRLWRIWGVFEKYVLSSASPEQPKYVFTERVCGVLQAVRDVELFEDTSERAVLEYVDRHLCAAGVPGASGCDNQAAFSAFFVLYNEVVKRVIETYSRESGRCAAADSSSSSSAAGRLSRAYFSSFGQDGRATLLVLEGRAGDSELEDALARCVHFNTLAHPSGSVRYTLLRPPELALAAIRHRVREVATVHFCAQEFKGADSGELAKCVSELRRKGLVLWYAVLTDIAFPPSASSSSSLAPPPVSAGSKRKECVTLLYAVEKLSGGDVSRSVEMDRAIELLATKGLSPVPPAADGSLCPAGTHCLQVLDPAHMAAFWHPTGDLAVCGSAPFVRGGDSSNGNSECAHVCPRAATRDCPELGDAAHLARYVHPPHLAVCACRGREGDGAHLAEFHGLPLPRCRERACPRVNDAAHRLEAYHARPALPACSALNLHRGAAFAANIAQWRAATTRFLGTDDVPALGAIAAWMENFRAVHQCSASALESILKVGAVTSLDFLTRLWADPAATARVVLLDPQVRALEAELAAVGGPSGAYGVHELRRYVRCACRVATGDRAPKCLEEIRDKIVMGIPVDMLKFASKVFGECPALSDAERAAEREAAAAVESALGAEKARAVRKCVEAAVARLESVVGSVKAIGFEVDRKIGTDRNVFAIHGPNMGDYGDAEVAVVFHAQAAHHPDAFLTPIAAMGYYQGWYIKNTKVGADRPWGGEAKHWNGGARDVYEAAKFQQGTPGWPEACALEWVARVVQNGHAGTGPAREARGVTLADVQDLWRKSNPHLAIETHLPGFVPLEYVERVYIRSGVVDDAKAKAIAQGLARYGVALECVDDTKDAVFDLFKSPPDAHASAAKKGAEIPAKMAPAGYLFTTQPGISGDDGPDALQDIPAPLALASDPDLAAVVEFAAVTAAGCGADGSAGAGGAEGVTTADLRIVFKDRDGAVLSRVQLPPRIGGSAAKMAGGQGEQMCVETAPGTPDAGAKVAGVLPGSGDVRVRVVVDGMRAEVVVLGPIGAQASAAWTLPAQAASLALGSNVFETTVWDLRVDHQKREDIVAVNIGAVVLEPADDKKGGGGRGGGGCCASPPAAKRQSLSNNAGLKPVARHDANIKINNNNNGNNGNNNNGNNGNNGNVIKKIGLPVKGIKIDGETIPMYYDPKAPMKKLCDTPFHCKEINKDKTHEDKFMHVCPYGVSCNKLDQPDHVAKYYHINKPRCPSGNCPQIADPVHRATYNHDRVWDFMIQCMNLQKCAKASDEAHKKKYYHDKKVFKNYYPPPPKVNLRKN